jgi:photosystem II stability/assembly factor-like uncharacterized protein
MQWQYRTDSPQRGTSSRLRRIGGLVVTAVMALTIASAGHAGISDINPDTSDSGNANASSGGRVNGLANASGNNQIYYAASEYGGIFKTTDGGNNWARLNAHLPVMAWDVETDPSNNDRVYATSWYDGRVNSLAGIQVSSDAGATWAKPATATPPGPYNCAQVRKDEPSAFGIAVEPGANQNVYIGTNCGVARSTDSGATWTFVDPTPATTAGDVWDVVAQTGGLVDICGADGHLRSTDGGVTWTADAGLGIPTGRCSIAASPDESYVLFVVASDNNVYETDDAGATWTNHGQNGGQGRIPFVVTNQRSDAGMTNRFTLWYSDTQLLRGDCTTPNPPAQGGAPRCGNTGGYSNQQTGAHWDAGDLVFDSAVAVDSCPMIYSSDGGVHRRIAGCESPTWVRSNVGVHALFIWSGDGASQAGNANEDLLFGLQDNGTFATTNGGAGSPTWTNPNCCDTFDVLADPAWELGGTCCFGMGRFNRLQRAGPGYAGAAEINTYPGAGTLPGFTYGHRLAQFGPDDVAMIMSDGIYVTNDINANPIVWSALAPFPGGGNGPCGIQASVTGGNVTFVVQSGQCTSRAGDQVFTYAGTGNAGTWNRIDNTDGLTGGFGIVAVDPNNPNNLYASNLNAVAPQMVFSTDGGTNWTVDPELDALMTANGAFLYRNQRGPATNRGGAGAGFIGYSQPTLLAYDPENSNFLVAGSVDAGIFLSVDNGTNWSLVTDPNAASKPHLPRPRDAFFDHEPVTQLGIYVFTQGRGVWRLTFQLPTADADGPYVTNEGTDVTLDASASSDPDGGPLTYAWDFDNDGQYDDATGVSPTFDRVGQDGVFPVSVKATDPDGGYDTASTTVTVNNVAPTVEDLADDGPQPENSPITVTGLIRDAGWLENLTATVDWGDGTPVENITGVLENVRPDATLTFSVSHIYGDDSGAGTFTAEICGFDDDTSTCDTIPLTITNVDPTAEIDLSGSIDINGKPTIIGQAGQPVTFNGDMTDPGSDDLVATWIWGDGTPNTVTTYLNDPNFDPDPDPSPTINPRDVTDTQDHTFGDACLYTSSFFSADDDSGVSPIDTVNVIIVGNGLERIKAEHWKHEFTKRRHSQFTDDELNCYLLITDYVSNVFHEVRDASTIEKAGDVLSHRAPPDLPELRHLDAEILAAWLNFANGTIGWNQMIDTGPVDMPFSAVMTTAEAVRNNPASTKRQIMDQRDLLRRVNKGAA